MDRGTCLWLLSSFCVWGASRGARETVLGTLGKATFLRIPPPFQELTARFGAAVWKRDTEDPHSKQVLLKYSDGNYINYMQEQTRFHQANFSLEILNTSRQDRQLYEYIVSKEREEKVWQIQLEVYEPVSAPRIQVLGGTEANDSLTVTLNCTAERGDGVSYSWAGASRLCARNGSVLHLSYSPRNASLACSCTCTAANPVSRRAVAFNASECGREPQGGAGLRTGHLVLVLVVPVVAAGALAAGCTALRAAGAKQERAPLAEDGAVHTIYSQVQRAEKPKGPRGPPAAERPACTTIYAAATGLPPDPAREQRPARGPRPEPPAPPRPPPRPQTPEDGPTTVYTTVTAPKP